MQIPLLIGIAASVLTGISMLPQLIKVIKDKKADDISYVMLIVLLAGLGLWSAYGVLKKDWIIVISNSFSFMVNLALLFLSIYYKKQNN
jgi:MtN3 and saliva related transmembrane protein